MSSPEGVFSATFPGAIRHRNLLARTLRRRNLPRGNLHRRSGNLHLRSRNLPRGNLLASNLHQRNLPRGNLHLRSSNLRLRRCKSAIFITKKALFAFRGQFSATKRTVFEFRGSKKAVFRTTVERNPRRPRRTPHRSAANGTPSGSRGSILRRFQPPTQATLPEHPYKALREQPRASERHRAGRKGAHTHGAHHTERGRVTICHQTTRSSLLRVCNSEASNDTKSRFGCGGIRRICNTHHHS